MSETQQTRAKVVPDEYDDRTFCVYTMDASTAFSLLLLSQTVRNTVTSCLCCGKGLISGCSTTCAVIFILS
ncbi:fiber protein Fb34 [Medicago truncatula]|uniref:Fiber protein Fb34 n=1 Tax=Medicago truncatula TaxID=3880 RepID=G7L0R2_MEDTR|nr:fiber protein Fb34 [Medicago truncatula]